MHHLPEPTDGPELDASRTVAIVLCLFTGGWGFHRIYMGMRSGWYLFAGLASIVPLLVLAVLAQDHRIALPIFLIGFVALVTPLVDLPRLINGGLRPETGWTQR